MTLEENVAAGIAVLDQKRPGWWKDINLDTLDIGGCWECMMGQLYGNYLKGLATLQVECGGLFGFFGLDDEVPALNDLWAAEITRRQQAKL